MYRALIVCVFLTGCASMTENQCRVDSGSPYGASLCVHRQWCEGFFCCR